MTKKKIHICFYLIVKNMNNEKHMGKENIVNDYWICRTIMGTIALEEETSIKTRTFLYQVVNPKKLSEVFRILNETMPRDFYDLADFYNELNNCVNQLWVEKVDEPQIGNNPSLDMDDIDLPDSWGMYAVTQSLKDKSKSGTDSDLSETLFDDFGNPKATVNDLKYWLEQEKQEQGDNIEDKKVEFKSPIENMSFNYGIAETFNFAPADGTEEIPELPEDNPFFREGNITTNVGHEFEIPINDETKKMLQLFNEADDFNSNLQRENKKEEFFPTTSESLTSLDDLNLNVEIGQAIEAPKVERVRKKSAVSSKSNIQNKNGSSSKPVRKRSFIEKILSLFNK